MQGGGALAGGLRAARCWQRTHRNGFAESSPGLFACGLYLCALTTRGLLSALGLPDQSPAGEAEESKPSSHRPANFKRDYKPGHRGKQRDKEPGAAPALSARGSGALALVAGRFWGQSRGYGKQRVRIFSGVDGRGESEKKRISTAPTLLYACLCSVSSSAGRPCSPGGGEGTGRRRRRGGALLRPFLPLSYLERTISRSASSVSDLWHSKPDYSSH